MAESTRYTIMPSRLHKLLNIHLAPPLLSQPDLDQILTNGLPPSTWTSHKHCGPTQRCLGPLRAPSLRGAWHHGAKYFVVFYLHPEIWTIIYPLNNFTIPSFIMSTIIATALATIYLHNDLPAPPLPLFRRVNRIGIQTDSPLAPWSCGSIAMLTTLNLTLGHNRPDNMNTSSISR